MKDLKAIPEIVKNVKVSADKIRYWISLLGAKTIRKGRISFIPFVIATQIEMMANLIANGISPKDAAKQVITQNIPNETTITVTTPDNNKFDALEKAILTMAKQMNSLSCDIKELKHENKILRLQLMPAQIKTQIIPWMPKITKRISYPWYKKLWFELISPELLRASSQ